MTITRAATSTSLIDVLDRVLDKGIVIDAWARVSLVGIDMITIESRVMVASFDTYLSYSEPLRRVPSVAGPRGIMDEQTWSPSPLPDGEEEKPPPRHHAARAARSRK